MEITKRQLELLEAIKEETILVDLLSAEYATFHWGDDNIKNKAVRADEKDNFKGGLTYAINQILENH